MLGGYSRNAGRFSTQGIWSNYDQMWRSHKYIDFDGQNQEQRTPQQTASKYEREFLIFVDRASLYNLL